MSAEIPRPAVEVLGLGTPFQSLTDVLIIGGGPAGLSAAINLARSLHTVVVFDSGVYRNRLLAHLHGVPGWDHDDPASIRTKMQEDLMARYNTTIIVNTTVERVARLEGEQTRFEVVDAQGRHWLGRKLVLATGVSDLLPDIPGYESCWVKGIYHCLTSQGYEERGSSSAGVLGVGDCASLRPCLRLAAQARQLSTHVRVYTNGDEKLTAELTANLLPLGGISVEEGQIASLSKESEGASVTVNLIDGVSHLESFLVHKPRMKVNGQFMQQLGLETFTFGHEIIKVTPPFHETSMSGVFAIGDCASPQKVFLNSLSMGSFACAGLAAQLQMKAPKTS